MSWVQKKLNTLELYTVDVILGRREDAISTLYGAFLQSLSILFSGAVQLRTWLYRHRIFHDQPLGCLDRKSTRLNSSHSQQSRMPSSA